MKKKQKLLKSVFTFLLFCTFSMLFFGCGKNGESKVQSERVEAKQLMDTNITFASKDSTDEDTSPEINTSQTIQTNDQIQMEQWRQLLEDLKSTLGDIKEGTEQAR